MHARKPPLADAFADVSADDDKEELASLGNRPPGAHHERTKDWMSANEAQCHAHAHGDSLGDGGGDDVIDGQALGPFGGGD